MLCYSQDPTLAMLLKFLVDIKRILEEHWKQIKHVLRYVKGTLDYSLCFNGHNLQLQGYIDANWQGDLDDRKSTSSYIFTHFGRRCNLVKQEAEFSSSFIHGS